MKNITNPILTIMIISIIHLLSSCQDFLDEKPSTDLVVPDNLEDIQALLDNEYIMNRNSDMGEVASDDYFISKQEWESWNEITRNAHVWADIISPTGRFVSWNALYEQVFYANVALEQLDDIVPDSNEQVDWDRLRGSALFYRSSAFYNLLRIFTMPYHLVNPELGIPLKLSADVNKLVKRSSIEDSYAQVIGDLEAALDLLPSRATIATRPSKQAVYGLLARVYLSMGDYQKVFDYTSLALELGNELMDYTSLEQGNTFGFKRLNEEVVYCSYFSSGSIGYSSDTFILSEIYKSYAAGDLRKSLFFTQPNQDGHVKFRGTYMGNLYLFDGVATDELLLNRAEAAVRLGNNEQALENLNYLLEHRFEAGKFEPIAGISGEVLLERILEERRKELVFRGLRWEDLRRLSGSQYEKTVTRDLDGEIYTLEPGSPKYAYPIPMDELQLNDMKQNPR
ncbi:RagB/SusD family nutrient uptake outer membrane protein [Echinicola marina]|uniref:RagB/SusD family nutrient uptake outer membrane protein n=1 Tax=Echinicola marina TaxID=2859768 RepID=UPI001CF67AE2|nr:RagB/SusD family nutrient uptake outer membrane protein [Echinicola marina]UCS93294.1 RagB/SusD family nutrient uptake outer membrane protein [Echinicola marina]UCS93959.1 RagB/SusD family nutrient uptake outer membrane protein [Echinicola marina]